jgi:tetratricopeptide (TPR) repeat protein
MHTRACDQTIETDSASDTHADRRQTLQLLQGYYQGQQHLRRGICLLNAGRYEHACEAFGQAARYNPESHSLPTLMAACFVGHGGYDAAAAELGKVVERDSGDVTARVRHALSLWQAGKRDEAVASLREGLIANPESAELHFQLGTMLAALEDPAQAGASLEEAEMRFTQAVAIDKNHAEALVSAGLCAAARQDPAEARRFFERAQRRKPHDARIGLLLAQAAKGLADEGLAVELQAEMPTDEPTSDIQAIDQLSYLIEAEPDFVYAFLEMPGADLNVDRSNPDLSLDRDVYAVLADTLNRALDRRPQHARLHCAAGQVFDRLGRPDEAVSATERAVDLDPGYAQALVQLARLYQQTDRHQDALARLKQALKLGVRYADVYYMMGNLYHRNGKLKPARWAYEQALKVNDRYEAARAALDSLAA